jgi:serine protease
MTNNGVGVAGIAPKAKIMPLKVLSKRGFGTAGDIADAVRFAADEGAHVLNLSLGGGPRSRVLESAVAYARKKGAVVVCAAGNGGRPRVEFPAAYRGAFAVSSVGPTKDLAFYSSYGKEVAVAGPGGDKNLGGDDGGILQNTIMQNRPDLTSVYLAYQGTSMATPHVAGVAALLVSSGVTNPDRVEAILKETAEDLGASGRDDRFGHGLVNAARAVNAAQSERGGLAQLGTALVGLLGLALGALRRFGKPALRLLVGPGALFGAAWASAGLGFLPGLLGLPLALWDLGVFGPGGHFSALWASALPMLGLTLAFLGFPKLRGLLAGLSVGWAAHLMVTAVSGSADVGGLPGVAGLLDRAWLVAQAGLLLALAAATARAALRR